MLRTRSAEQLNLLHLQNGPSLFANMATEKVATSIPIEEYDPERHDFDEYFDLLGNAVGVATNTKGARRDELTVQWVPLKLNGRTRKLWNDCKKTLWKDLKPEFKELLRDPQDAYRWRAGHVMVVWDGKENFNEYASRVKRTVDTYENPARETDYYHHFRKGLPKEYKKAIDLGRNAETLEEAKRVATRFRMAEMAEEEADPSAPTKSVTFTGASMDPDRLKAIELGLQSMSVKVDNFGADLKKLKEDRHKPSTRDEYESSRGGRSESRGRETSDRKYRRDSPYQRDSRDRYDSRDRRDDRGRRDSRDRDRRDDRNRRDSRDRYRYRDDRRDDRRPSGRSRRDSYEDDRRYDRRGRYNSGSRDRRYSRDDRRYSRDNRRDSRDRRHDSREIRDYSRDRYDRKDRGYDRDSRDSRNGSRGRDSREYSRDRRDRPRGHDDRDEYNKLDDELDSKLIRLADKMLKSSDDSGN